MKAAFIAMTQKKEKRMQKLCIQNSIKTNWTEIFAVYISVQELHLLIHKELLEI